MTPQLEKVVRAITESLAGAGFRLVADSCGSMIPNIPADLRVEPMSWEHTNPGQPCPEHLKVSARDQAYAAACLSGRDPNLDQTVRMRFACSGNNQESIQLSFDSGDSAQICAPDLGYAATLTPAQNSVIPVTLKGAIAALESQGFCVRGFGGGAYIGTIPMSRGTKVFSGSDQDRKWTGAVIGIHAELTWYGD